MPVAVQENPTSNEPTVAWGEADLAQNPHAAADKAQRVQRMFSAIAPSYDLNNRLHSLWRDQVWRRAAVEAANVKTTDRVLDVACGTGDLAMAFAAKKPASVLGVDFTYNMLAVAQRKAPRLAYATGDAMRLPLPGASVDVVSIAFGIRNVADPLAALREFYRVLRPGGRVIVLEFSLPTNPVMRGLYNTYFHHVLPRTASWIARDRSGAYRYLPRSVNTFINRDTMRSMMHGAGFDAVTVKPMTLGIAVIYRGVKRV
ncbi:MAG: bifunctional demethylmenaquinone methyltransferase/2-methoxy-6-polyprenyl-1,4-benzoquinol methylase UbiE [Phycisphaera sp.]|nr:bifunctional demethylmenaquinone methyltransferase/2-methoxy-6-polyprenyl-1,4-benzoquinol methylase UbiE [Phycisphaera sp.]